MASLLHRARTGRGMWIDLAMYQVGVSFVGEGLLDFAFNGRRSNRIGNRHQFMAPHGCYPCKGNDEWVTLAVRDDADWRALSQILKRSRILNGAQEEKFALPANRLQNQEELDGVISRWTSSQVQYQVMETLQAAGIPAGPVLNARGLLADPHFAARGFFEAVEHPPSTGLGRREYIGRGWKLSDNDLAISRPAPLLGEHNDYVLRQVLGIAESGIEDLARKGLIGDSPQGGRVPNSVPLERQVELGWTVERDQDYRPR